MITLSTTDEVPHTRHGSQFFGLSQEIAEMPAVRSRGDERPEIQSFDSLGCFAMSVVHDFRNPLAAICAGTEMLKEPDLTPANVKTLAGNIHAAALRMCEQISNLIGFVKEDSSACRIYDLREIVAAALDAAQTAKTPRLVRTLFNVPNGIKLHLARWPIQSVFFNVIGNAMEAMPHGGTLRIDAWREQDQVFTAVDDTGLGIPKAVRDRLFERFATAGKSDGLGLGLALARQILRSHGGDIFLQPGAHTRFVIRLPIRSFSTPPRTTR